VIRQIKTRKYETLHRVVGSVTSLISRSKPNISICRFVGSSHCVVITYRNKLALQYRFCMAFDVHVHACNSNRQDCVKRRWNIFVTLCKIFLTFYWHMLLI